MAVHTDFDAHAVSAVDQGAEALSSSGRVSILSMSQDPVNQQYIATGGSDPYGEPVWPSSAQALGKRHSNHQQSSSQTMFAALYGSELKYTYLAHCSDLMMTHACVLATTA